MAGNHLFYEQGQSIKCHIKTVCANFLWLWKAFTTAVTMTAGTWGRAIELYNYTSWTSMRQQISRVQTRHSICEGHLKRCGCRHFLINVRACRKRWNAKKWIPNSMSESNAQIKKKNPNTLSSRCQPKQLPSAVHTTCAFALFIRKIQETQLLIVHLVFWCIFVDT